MDTHGDPSLILKSKRNDITLKAVSNAAGKICFELWSKNGFIESQNVPDVSKIYNDSCFGGVSWPKDGSKVVFISEN